MATRTHENLVGFRPAALFRLLFLVALPFACEAGPTPTPVEAQQPRVVLNTEVSHRFHTIGSLAHCKREVNQWKRGRAYEKLALAEGLLASMITDQGGEPLADYAWKPGTNDLRLAAGRAKWARERLLGIRVPGLLTKKATRDQIRKAHAIASCSVEAYRRGIMAMAADDHVLREQLEHLRRKYKARIVTGFSPNAMECSAAMDALLGEWPPVGREYGDLAFIVGETGERRDHGACYMFRGNRAGSEFVFIVRAGLIRSVERRPLD